MTNEQENALIEFLKSPDINARVDVDTDKWMYWQINNSLTNEGEWVVQYRPYAARKTRCLYSGEVLSEAIEALKGEG